MAESIISAKRSSTRASVIRQTTWGMQSRNVREAYLWQVVLGEGGRYGVTAPERGPMSKVIISALFKSVDTREAFGYRYLRSRQPQSPFNW